MSGGALDVGMPYVEYDEVEAACAECGRLFRSEEALEAHRTDAHPGEAVTTTIPSSAPTIRCTVCRMSFATLSALQRHNRQAHTN
ncbi:MAG: C2H2-type zinc finger protein [Thermoplasmata archaeon]|nr:C2H2-type zinc finger protein [Thermoplasmata archaeon]